MARAAAVCSILLGLGFGLPGVAGARHFAATGEVWTFLGFPTYGDGPFTRWGVPTTTPLLWGFVAVCTVEIVLGVLLLAGWGPTTWLCWLCLALLPFELVFWTGFALPFGFVLGLVRTALVVAVLAAD